MTLDRINGIPSKGLEVINMTLGEKIKTANQIDFPKGDGASKRVTDRNVENALNEPYHIKL